MAQRISKSRFQKGLQCEKALWLGVRRHDLAAPTSESMQWIFDQGTEVGRLAQQMFPGGVEVAEDHLHQAEALATTTSLIEQGVTVLYEPAFEFDGAFARVDVLASTGDGRWDLYEVKSTARVKPVHVTDAAVQVYAVEGAGFPVRTASIVHLNSKYVYPGGAYDPSALFITKDVTEDARSFLPTIPETLRRFQRVLDGPEPSVRIGTRCSDPYSCEFAGYCRSFLPERFPVTQLPRLSDAALQALLDMDVTCIKDVPDQFGLLTSQQRETVEAVKSGSPRVDLAGLGADLDRLEWPVYHLDFETVAPALPIWRGTGPYQSIPFQYSIYVHHEDGSYEHREYLHDGPDDPRRSLAGHMLADLEERGSVVHYSPYEAGVIRGLAASCPECTDGLNLILGRLYDLERVIKRNTKHPEACGRTSIKFVLPAWCPDLSYAGMHIADGQTASVRYLKVVKGQLPQDEVDNVRADLIEYCSLDTYAMVRLLEELRKRNRG